MPTVPTFFGRGDEAKVAFFQAKYGNKNKYIDELRMLEGRFNILNVTFVF